MSNFLASLIQTVTSTATVAANTGVLAKPTKKKKGPGCTPCAVNARVLDAKARAGVAK